MLARSVTAATGEKNNFAGGPGVARQKRGDAQRGEAQDCGSFEAEHKRMDYCVMKQFLSSARWIPPSKFSHHFRRVRGGHTNLAASNSR
jgi:hypothetical protein